MRGVAWCVLCLAACGHVGFETEPDGAIGDSGVTDAAAPPRFVHGTAHGIITTGSLPVTIPATAQGSMLAIGLTQESGTTATIASISDDTGSSYHTANVRSVDTSCANTAEIWFASSVAAGTTTVTITMSSSVEIEAWVVELAGVSKPDHGETIDTHASAQMATAPSDTPTLPAIVVSTLATCGAVSSIAPTSNFIALPIENGEDTAYEIALTPGSYGATWTYGGGSWNASTVAFE